MSLRLYGFKVNQLQLFGPSFLIFFILMSQFHVVSYPAALSLKLANNGFGPKPSSGGSGI